MARRSAANPQGLVYYSSQQFSGCPASPAASPRNVMCSGGGANAQQASLVIGLAASTAILAGGIMMVICADLYGRSKSRRRHAGSSSKSNDGGAPAVRATGLDVEELETLNPLSAELRSVSSQQHRQQRPYGCPEEAVAQHQQHLRTALPTVGDYEEEML